MIIFFYDFITSGQLKHLSSQISALAEYTHLLWTMRNLQAQMTTSQTAETTHLCLLLGGH